MRRGSTRVARQARPAWRQAVTRADGRTPRPWRSGAGRSAGCLLAAGSLLLATLAAAPASAATGSGARPGGPAGRPRAGSWYHLNLLLIARNTLSDGYLCNISVPGTKRRRSCPPTRSTPRSTCGEATARWISANGGLNVGIFKRDDYISGWLPNSASDRFTVTSGHTGFSGIGQHPSAGPTRPRLSGRSGAADGSSRSPNSACISGTRSTCRMVEVVPRTAAGQPSPRPGLTPRRRPTRRPRPPPCRRCAGRPRAISRRQHRGVLRVAGQGQSQELRPGQAGHPHHPEPTG